MSEALGAALVVPKSAAEEALAQIQPVSGSGTYPGLSKMRMFSFRSGGKFIGTCRSAVFEAARGSHLVWRINTPSHRVMLEAIPCICSVALFFLKYKLIVWGLRGARNDSCIFIFNIWTSLSFASCPVVPLPVKHWYFLWLL